MPSDNTAHAYSKPNEEFEPSRIAVRGPRPHAGFTVLTPEALRFLELLQARFGPRLKRLLARRTLVQAELDAGWRPDFMAKTSAVRTSDWKVGPVPDEIADRRIEITGPVDRRMVVNALNSGARVYMADFEDSSSPTFENMVTGQRNLMDAVRDKIDFQHETSGKHYKLEPDRAALFVRPRGLHLSEAHVTFDEQPMSASLFDFGLYFFHNAQELMRSGHGVYFYLPKLESYLEARFWNQVFLFAQAQLAIPAGTIKATVLIEHVLASFQMDEILFELREHSAGLNCGRWDYIFSFIKSFRNDPDFVLGDRGAIGMDSHFLASYSRLLVSTCHRRGAFAMGGMAAQIPIKNDEARNRAALEKVRADKEREATGGYDGTWVAHPALIPTALAEFDKVLSANNQIALLTDATDVRAADLLQVPPGTITEAGLRQNLRVGTTYLAAWLSGNGCVPIDHLMEDAATAEISRTQVWQWLHHRAQLADGRTITKELVQALQADELRSTLASANEDQHAHFELASKLIVKLVTDDSLASFITLPAYTHITSLVQERSQEP